jgi:CspA family cold shock protein
MERGTVKWFNNSKGYGFLLSEDQSKEVFIHYSSISMDGYRTLRTGQPVLFQSSQGPKGFHATAIEVIGSDTPSNHSKTT